MKFERIFKNHNLKRFWFIEQFYKFGWKFRRIQNNIFIYCNFSFNFQIIPGGPAAATGKLRMGDRILSVNGIEIKNASHQDAVAALLVKTDRMKLKVQHDPLPEGFKVNNSIILRVRNPKAYHKKNFLSLCYINI